MRSLMRVAGLVGVLMAGSGAVGMAQAVSTSKLIWDQPGNGDTVAVVGAYTFKVYADGSGTGTALTGVSCTGTGSPFVCQAAFPAVTPGAHTLQVTAANVAGESGKSTAFSFTFVVVPGVPGNIRIGG